MDSSPVDTSAGFFTIEGGLPIQLASFTGRATANGVMLEWMTLSEINNYGFEVQMSPAGHGTTNIPHTYQYLLVNPPPSAFYRLKQIDLDGTFWFSEGIHVIANPTHVPGSDLPEALALHQSYPNPFNPSTTIRYDLPLATHATVEVFNTVGERVATLVNEQRPAGRHILTFVAEGLPSGVYFCRLQTVVGTHIIRMMLMK
jgi:hypothetical protein